MKTLRTTLRLATLLSLAVSSLHAQATLYGIGDLSGGNTYSTVGDATKSSGTIYAVGGSSAGPGTNNNDRAVFWSSSGGLTPITDIVTNTAGTGGILATAITSDGSGIAARLHNNASSGVFQAAYISSSALGSPTALGVLSGTGIATPNSNVGGMSSDGSIIWGSAQYTSSNGALTKLVRYSNSANSITAIPLAAGYTNMFLFSQAAVSANGNMVVGIANNGASNFRTAGTVAFIYNNSSNDMSTDVPFLTGGTWNAAFAINSAGTLGLVGGNSSTYANGAVYLYNDTTNTLLGSPNAAYTLAGGNGMTDDGSIVAATFTNGSTPISYIHNANGWFEIGSVASTYGANLTGWSGLVINGMSADGTLVWGSGNHSGNTEGFVLEFGTGNLTAVPEPSTYAMFAGLGALGLALWRRRQARLAA